MDYQEAADARAYMAFSEMLVRRQTAEFIRERRKMFKIASKDKVCANCRKFYQHYVINGAGRFLPIARGHCCPCGKGFKDTDWTDNCEHFEAQ